MGISRRQVVFGATAVAAGVAVGTKRTNAVSKHDPSKEPVQQQLAEEKKKADAKKKKK